MTANHWTRTLDGQRFEPGRQQIMCPDAAGILSVDKAALANVRAADQKPLCTQPAGAHALPTNEAQTVGGKRPIIIPAPRTVEDQAYLRPCSDGPWAVELVTPRRSVTGETFVVFAQALAAYRHAGRLALDGVYRSARLVSLTERRVIACAESGEEDNQSVEPSKDRRARNKQPGTENLGGPRHVRNGPSAAAADRLRVERYLRNQCSWLWKKGDREIRYLKHLASESPPISDLCGSV